MWHHAGSVYSEIFLFSQRRAAGRSGRRLGSPPPPPPPPPRAAATASNRPPQFRHLVMAPLIHLHFLNGFNRPAGRLHARRQVCTSGIQPERRALGRADSRELILWNCAEITFGQSNRGHGWSLGMLKYRGNVSMEYSDCVVRLTSNGFVASTVSRSYQLNATMIIRNHCGYEH